MDASVWEAVFFLLALKIPLLYVGYIVWRAIRAEPEPPQPEALVPVTDTPPEGPAWSPRRPERGALPHRPGRRTPPPRTVSRHTTETHQ
jgi:hypothetical protein